jgi:hypothetical protein
MSDFQWPGDIIPTDGDFHLEPNGVHLVSPLSGATQSISRGGTRWVYSMSFGSVTRAKAQRISALAAEVGYGNRVWLHDHTRNSALGSLGGTPLINGTVSIGATSAAIDGCSNSITDWAKAGDLVQFLNPAAGTSQMVEITRDADTDGSGTTTLYFTPALRIALEDNAYVVFTTAGDTLLTEGSDDLVTEDGDYIGTGGLAQAKFVLRPGVGRQTGPGAIHSGMALEFIEDIT